MVLWLVHITLFFRNYQFSPTTNSAFDNIFKYTHLLNEFRIPMLLIVCSVGHSTFGILHSLSLDG